MWRALSVLHSLAGAGSRPSGHTDLVPIVVHGDQAVDVVDVAAPGQLSYQVRLDRGLWALVARGSREALHADGAVLWLGARGKKAKKTSALTSLDKPGASGELLPLLFQKVYKSGVEGVILPIQIRFCLALHDREIPEIIPGSGQHVNLGLSTTLQSLTKPCLLPLVSSNGL